MSAERIKALEDALRPFADFAAARGFDRLPDNLPMTHGSSMAGKQVTARDFKEAHETLAASQPAPERTSGAPITITYTNWRGDTEVRRIIPRRIWWGSTEWHPEPQWLLTAFDVDKQAERDFALKDFDQPITVQDAARVMRGGEVVVVDGHAYNLRDLADASYATVKGLGSKNPGFDMPMWFFTGSPYADQIKALGVQPMPVPDDFCAEYLPQSNPGPSRCPAIWQHYTMALDAVDDRISIQNAALILLDAEQEVSDAAWSKGVTQTAFRSVLRAIAEGRA